MDRGAHHQSLVDSLVSPPGTHPTTTSSAGPSARGIPHSPSFPARRISLIQEECLIEEDEEEMLVDDQGLDEQVRSAEGSDESTPPGSGSASGSPAHGSPSRHHHHSTSAGSRRAGVRPLHTVRSSPQLLNQIFEEGESEDDDTLHRRLNIHRKAIASPEVIRKYEHRKKRLTSGNRGTSCSSSDASDTDETDSRKRKEKLKQKFHRRDSSDLSSDNDGGPNSGGNGPSAGNRSCPTDNDSGQNNRENNKDNKDKGSSGKGRNSENRHGTKSAKERRHSIASPGAKQPVSNKRDPVCNSSENLPQFELGRRISTLSVGSNLSNLSLASINSRSSKYLVESSPNTPRSQSGQSGSDVDALNEENRARTRIIHVRSKEFSDLRDRFSNSHKSDPSLGCREPHSKLRRRSKDRIKTDINRNGLIARTDGSFSEMDASSQQHDPQTQNIVQSGVVTTKCCSLV